MHESTLRLKKFDEVDKSENRSLELEYPFQYSVPSGAPSSLEANPTEYCNFEVGYFLEAHLTTSGASKAKKISANQQIQVLGLPNVPVLRNQEYERTFKLKGFMAFLRSSSFTSKAMLATNQATPGTSLAIEMTLDNSHCSEPVSAVRIGLARTVVVPKNIVKKKYKLEAEELVFATSGSLPGNQKETRVIHLVIPQTTTEKHSTDERPQGKTRRARMTQSGKPLRLAPSY